MCSSAYCSDGFASNSTILWGRKQTWDAEDANSKMNGNMDTFSIILLLESWNLQGPPAIRNHQASGITWHKKSPGKNEPFIFLSTISEVMLSYKRKPTPKDRTRIAIEIVQKYPFLGSPLTDYVGYTFTIKQLFLHVRVILKC